MSYYEPITYHVSREEEGFLLRTILTSKLQISRKLLAKIKRTERGVLVNGQQQLYHVPVREGNLIEVRLKQEQSDDILAQPLPLDVIYEDEHLLVVHKAAGMIVHPTHGHYINTVANAVVYYWQQAGKCYRFRPVHRLDQETSGVLVIAKNAYIHQQISQQLIAHQVQKQYHAWVWGIVEHDQGTIDAAIDRSEEDPHTRIVTSTGYSAITHYRVVQRFAKATQVEFQLETGRTHQIRVHAHNLGHPLIGDKRYISEVNSYHQQICEAVIDRQALHAYAITFNHPITKRDITFHAPHPNDIQALHSFLQTYV